MKIIAIPSPAEAAAWCNLKRDQNLKIGYVATMGALHQGHVSLLNRCISDNDVSCTSIFVNPLQFNNAEDLEKYPSTYDSDLRILQEAGCDMVFTGQLNQFFPEHNDMSTIPTLDAGEAAKGLEGKFRPGHLQGVATIVDRLFRTVGDCNTYFGEKDYQQTLVVRDLSAQLQNEGLNINVKVCPTIRERSGLALSSRNQRLTTSQKSVAAKLYESLSCAKTLWSRGCKNSQELESAMQNILAHPDINIEYTAIRDETNWTEFRPEKEIIRPRALVAAYLDEIRLIDNMGTGVEPELSCGRKRLNLDNSE